MQTSRFITKAITESRQAYIFDLLDRLETNQTRGAYVSSGAVAESVGFIAVSSEPLTVSEVAAKTERDYNVVKRAAVALNNAGFIDKNLDTKNDGNGRPPALLIPNIELYEGIALKPDWQATARICMLATLRGVTIGEAIDQAVCNQLGQRGLVIPVDASQPSQA